MKRRLYAISLLAVISSPAAKADNIFLRKRARDREVVETTRVGPHEDCTFILDSTGKLSQQYCEKCVGGTMTDEGSCRICHFFGPIDDLLVERCTVVNQIHLKPAAGRKTIGLDFTYEGGPSTNVEPSVSCVSSRSGREETTFSCTGCGDYDNVEAAFRSIRSIFHLDHKDSLCFEQGCSTDRCGCYSINHWTPGESCGMCEIDDEASSTFECPGGPIGPDSQEKKCQDVIPKQDKRSLCNKCRKETLDIWKKCECSSLGECKEFQNTCVQDAALTAHEDAQRETGCTGKFEEWWSRTARHCTLVEEIENMPSAASCT